MPKNFICKRMGTMKHLRSLATLFLLLCLLTACGSEEKPSEDPALNAYIKSAQMLIETGSYAEAKVILEEAVAAIGEHEDLVTMLREVESNLDDIEDSEDDSGESITTNETTDLSLYYGVWATDDVGWAYGGMILEFSLTQGHVTCALTYTQGAPSSRVAYLDIEIDPASVKKGVFSTHYDEDGWGNSGDLKFTFSNKKIVLDISNICSTDQYPMWGLSEGSYTLKSDSQAHSKMDYTMDMYYELFAQDSYYEETIDYIELGGIRYDDVSSWLPISLEQIKQDTVTKKINYFYVNHVNTAFEITHLLPIKGGYTDKYDMDEYKIHCYGCFSNGSIVYEAKFSLTYKYNTIGGWVLSSGSISKKIERSNSPSFVPFGVEGKKLGNFSYTDYQSGSPLSVGEIVDDILYSKLNIINVNDVEQYFNINSIKIISGEYWENEFHDYLNLVVTVGFTNDYYDASFDLELEYQYYDAGGWELSIDYIDSDFNAVHRSDGYTIWPKVNTYNDAEFIEKTKTTFDKCSRVSTNETVDEKGNKMLEIYYQAVRDKQYVKEYYDILLVAKFLGRHWVESLTITLTDADYSPLIGTWEYCVDNEYIRLQITDAALTINSGKAYAYISYFYETSAWGTSPYQKAQSGESLSVSSSYFAYKNNYYTMLYHETPFAIIEEHLGSDSTSHAAQLNISSTKGVYLRSANNDYFSEDKAPLFKKIS